MKSTRNKVPTTIYVIHSGLIFIFHLCPNFFKIVVDESDLNN